MTNKTLPRSGILLLNKQAGLTSFDCIRRLKKILNRSDFGHGGTLDKFATGLLPVLFGDGLKLVRFFLENYPALATYWKSYSGVFEFGVSTATGDPEGEVLERRDVTPGLLSIERVNEAMSSFVGAVYEQTPPLYSAKKVGGERASDITRDGRAVELKPVKVVIRRFECTGIVDNRISFIAECSKGTYVRVLAQDLARKLDSVAHVVALRRDAVGSFMVDQALTIEQITEQGETAILDMATATSFLPRFALIGAESEQLSVGKVDGLAMRLANSGLSASVYCAARADGQPAALLELTPEKRVTFLRAFQIRSDSALN